MKGIRKLLSLNLALIFLLSCFATAVPAGAVVAQEPEHQYDKYIIVDGTEYDVTASPSGEGWELYYYETNESQQFELSDYNGGPIYTNVGLHVFISGNNFIKAENEGEYGIYVEGDIYLGEAYNPNSYKAPMLTVEGGMGHAAIFATGDLDCSSPLTATGGSASALIASTISISLNRPNVVSVGNSPETAIPGEYTGQNHIKMVYIPYSLMLEGNGGVTVSGNTKQEIVSDTATRGSLELYPFLNTFTKADSALLGWTEKPDGAGTYYTTSSTYEFAQDTFEATLYAFWEDDANKAVILKDYYGSGANSSWTEVIRQQTGATFTLPDSMKPGAKLAGWHAEDGSFYEIGQTITVAKTITFTPEYTPLKLSIGGVEYDADKRQHGAGWSYYPQNPSAQLDIKESYSGGDITIPCNVNIYPKTSLTESSIYVDGDVYIGVWFYEPIPGSRTEMTGSTNKPAIAASGEVAIHFSSDTDEDMLIIQGGGDAIPAISSEKGVVLVDAKVYHAGADANSIAPIGKYSGQHYVQIKESWGHSVQLSGTETAPSVPENAMYTFFGWSESRQTWQPTVWYKPGDTVEAGSGKTLWANYLHYNRSSVAISIDGNGGKTSTGSKYFMRDVSNDNLSLYRLPASEFTYSDHTLKGYNSKADGSGTSYAKGGTVQDDGRTFIYELYAQWEQDSGGTGDGGGGGGGGGAAPIDPVADAIKQATKNGNITLEPPSKGEGVTLTQEHIKEILEKSLSVEAKTEMGALKLSAETLAKLAKENEGKELKFTLGKADDADKISVGGLFLNLSVSAGGKEIHDVSGSAKIHLDGVGKGDVVTLVHYNADGTVKDVSFITVKESALVEFQFESLSYYSLLKRNETPAYLVFGDVGEKAWFGKAVSYAYQNKLFDGTSATTFSPDMKMNREMFATVLYRLAGSPAFSGESMFSDVADSSTYYYSAILWCAQNGIINGYPDGRFGVGDLVTREQMVSMLYRYAKDYAKVDVAAGADDPLQTYMDAVDISKGAYEAFRWAVGAGVLRGATATVMLPQATATRAEVAQILMNYAKLK